MPRNGFNTGKSSSPLTMQSASPLTATSRNLLSFGSRQSVTLSMISTGRIPIDNTSRKSILSSSVSSEIGSKLGRRTRRGTSEVSRWSDFHTARFPPVLVVATKEELVYTAWRKKERWRVVEPDPGDPGTRFGVITKRHFFNGSSTPGWRLPCLPLLVLP